MPEIGHHRVWGEVLADEVVVEPLLNTANCQVEGIHEAVRGLEAFPELIAVESVHRPTDDGCRLLQVNLVMAATVKSHDLTRVASLSNEGLQLVKDRDACVAEAISNRSGSAAT